jgi:hypothetical protein
MQYLNVEEKESLSRAGIVSDGDPGSLMNYPRNGEKERRQKQWPLKQWVAICGKFYVLILVMKR